MSRSVVRLLDVQGSCDRPRLTNCRRKTFPMRAKIGGRTPVRLSPTDALAEDGFFVGKITLKSGYFQLFSARVTLQPCGVTVYLNFTIVSKCYAHVLAPNFGKNIPL